MVCPTWVSLHKYSPRRSGVSIISLSQKPSPIHKQVYIMRPQIMLSLLDMFSWSGPNCRLLWNLLLKEMSCKYSKSVSVDSRGTFTIWHSTRIILLVVSSGRLYTQGAMMYVRAYRAHTLQSSTRRSTTVTFLTMLITLVGHQLD